MSVLGIQYTSESFPAGSGPIATIAYSITGSAAGNTTPITGTIPLNATSLTVTLIADTYTWTLTNSDAATPPNTYGGPFSGSFVIQAPATVSLSLASGLTVVSS
jgi:hypothetical protein